MTDTVRVPREPTEAMVNGAAKAVCNHSADFLKHDVLIIYRAMLAASPQGEGSSADDIGHELIAFANQVEGASHDARAAAVQFFSERIAYRVTEGVKP